MQKFERILLVLGLVFGCAGVAQANTLEDKTSTVRYRLNVAANVSTAAVVVDLSDTVNWPHKQNRELSVVSLRVEVDKLAASTCTVKVGVVNFVNASTGSVTWFHVIESTVNTSNTNIQEFSLFTPNYVRLRVDSAGNAVNGLTPYLLSNDKTSGSTTYQTDVPLPTPAGNAAPGRGDIVLFVQSGVNASITVGLQIQYISE